MIIAILGVTIVTTFCIMFVLEDRDGVGVYDPDPTASDRHKLHNKK